MPFWAYLSSRLSITRVSAQLLYRVMPSGKYSCRLLAHSLFVVLLTFFLQQHLSVDVFLLHSSCLLLPAIMAGLSQPFILSFQRLRPAMIHCFFLFMLLTVFLVLQCHLTSSDCHNPRLSLVSYKIS